MNYLEHYLSGEYEQVWNDLQALGSAIRHEPYASQAQAVAVETMRRVRRNCERIVARLQVAGYSFGIYPDGTQGYYTDGPLVESSEVTRAEYAALEAQAGPIPLSLAAFWQEVGSIDFVGMHPLWPKLLDPLVVYAPVAALAELDDWEGEDEASLSGQVIASLAPDDLHKDNISGGEPYSVALPNPSADFLVLHERHELCFVPYLRLAILKWGGFPGLDQQPNTFEPLAELIADLEAF